MQIPLLRATRLSILTGCLLVGQLVLNGQDFALSQMDDLSGMVIQSQERPLADVIHDLSKKHEVFFTYEVESLEQVKVDYPRLLSNQTDLKTALKHLLSGTTLKYKQIDEKYYVIFAADTRISIKQVEPATTHLKITQQKIAPVSLKPTVRKVEEQPAIQFFSVSGTVASTEGEVLAGATVRLKGGTQGTLTDEKGYYALEVPDENGTLIVSYIGYLSQEIPIQGRVSIDVEMEVDYALLEEVVVVGYGTQKKSDLTGAVSSISEEELKSMPLASLDQGIQGRAAGVFVTQTTGQPGGVATIRIRGGNSLQGGNEPLYVIDGFPIYNGGGLPTPGNGPNLNGLATINPNDIESIEILKDASATAIYGSRGANGVVIITTKSGRQGKDQLSFESYYGFQEVRRVIDVLNARQYGELVREAYLNDGLTPPITEAEVQTLGVGTNWQDEIFQTAPMQNYQLSFSGGDDKTRYAITGNYFSQDGIIINSYFERLSARVNIDRQVNSRMNVGSHLTLSRSNSNTSRTDGDGGGGTGVVLGSIMMSPILSVFENEDLGIYRQLNDGILLPNPVATAQEILNENITTRLLGDIYLTWELLEGLEAKISLGADVLNNKGNHFIPSFIYQGTGTNGFGEVESRLSTTWLNENTLTYNKQINDNNSINVLAGITFQGNRTEFVRASSQDYVTDALEENSLQSGATFNMPNSSATEWGLVSYIGRINYNFKEKYLLTATARVDGSSRFGEGNKYGFYPSGSIAWRMSEEEFIQNLGIFDNLKMRLSYGVTGNQEIGLYNSLATMASNSYTFGNSLATGFRPNRIPNPDLQWERTTQYDLGIDMGFFNNRLRLTTDLYYKKTTDLLYSASVPWTSGFASSLQNIGSVENKGLEFAVQSDNFVGDFTWTTNFNIAFNRNEVLDLGEVDFFFDGGGSGHLKVSQVSRIAVGEPIGSFWGFQFDGIFQSEEEVANSAQPNAQPGDRRYIDLNGDGEITPGGDRSYIGRAQPDFFGGITNTIQWKGIELNVFFQYSYGNDIFNYNRIELELPTGGQNVSTEMLDRWTPTNPSNTYPRATRSRVIFFSDRYIEDGSFLRLKTLTLAYNFPSLNIPLLSGLKLYVSTQNLWTWTNYTGFDPEVSRYGVTNLNIGQDYGGYPMAKSYIAGLNVNLK